MPFIDDVNRLLRDHEGYTGDGQGGVGPLPVGDRSTARRAIWKRDLRDLFITLAQTTGDPSALQDILDELDDKADLANSGAFFTSRAAMVSTGQSALPGSKGLAFHPDGDYLVVRGFNATSDDPLFETAPRWGVLMRVPNEALLDAKADFSALRHLGPVPLTSIGGTGDAITATIAPQLGFTTLVMGQVIVFTAAATNTGPATITINDITYNILPGSGAAATLPADTIVSGRHYQYRVSVVGGAETPGSLRPVTTAMGDIPGLIALLDGLDEALDQKADTAALQGKLDRIPHVVIGAGDAALSVDDDDGNRAFEVGLSGVTRAGVMQIGEALMRPVDAPGWVLPITDAEGNIAGGWRDDGSFAAIGFDPGGDGPPQTVQFAFAEPHRDPSQNLLLTWVSDSADAVALEYRVDGAGAWTQVASHRRRPWPEIDGLHLHTALMDGLAPDTVYELRWPGATFTDRVRTSRRAAVRVCVASDYQRTTYDSGSLLAEFGGIFAAQECDLLIFNGDFVNDDGLWTQAMGERWLGFMAGLSRDWRRDGALVPVAATLGNHEGRNAAGTGNALMGGDGTPGMMVDIFSLGFDPEGRDYVNRSAWAISIGREVGFVSIETHHTVPLASQADWLAARLAEMAPRVRHLNVVGHSPALYGYWSAWETSDGQARTLKSTIWPIMEDYAGLMRGYWCGHEHRISMTARLRMDWDAGLPATTNDLRWITDPTGGIRQLGSGMIGGTTNALTPGLYDQVSGVDGSPKFLAIAGHDGTVFDAHGAVDTSGATDLFNMWIADFSAQEFSARCIGRGSHQFIIIEETL
ncbi:metallophosphoesterase [Paracoccus versutus]|uniref:Calcineurin-like phosphoesterase family protein n=1 Tax=Paracoccus versutus TaxID=34007 RepID=A0A3D9XHR4_PARVE|nr:metallophosphoesterase [Paracoccus versutus]REF69964.1 calcineurin-like phosphoesterase family protein [Paracoccus versutus]WGR57693.1 metallophosphoesterase family protein [Paracoccus versutus]